jgi:hypothetical protein
MRPQKRAKVKMGGTGVMQVAKNATPVVDVVRSIAPAASLSAISAISSVLIKGFDNLAFFHLSTATNKSSAPNAAETKSPIQLIIGKLLK